MPNKPRIAVLMAAYNGEKWLEEQVLSIIFQKNVEVYLFISLDNSSDGSKEVIERLANVYKNIKLIREGVFGSAGKNFYGLIKDEGIPLNFDYYSLADQDDVWLNDKLYQAITLLEETGSDAYSSNVTAFWPDGREQLIVKSQPQKQWDYLFEAAGPGCTYVMSVRLFSDVSSYLCELEQPVERFEAHDWLLYAFARSRNYAWVIDSRSFMRYRQHASNQVGANHGWKAYLRRLKAVVSGEWFAKVEILINILQLNHLPPAQLLMEKKSPAYFKLATMCTSFRRRTVEQFYLAAFLIIFSLKKLVKK